MIKPDYQTINSPATEAMSKDLITRFSTLTDPRREHRRLYTLSHILFLNTIGVLAGCNDCQEVESFGFAKSNWFQSLGLFPNGMPSHDTICRVLRLLKPRPFQQLFSRWISDLIGPVSGVLAIDGKTSRSSADGENGTPLHTVSVYASDAGVTLAHVDVGEKSNEIPYIPIVIEKLEIAGAMVTSDAMGCQTDIATAIRKKKADYLLAVKDNQPTLLGNIKSHFSDCTTKKWKNNNKATFSTTQNEGHGRTEFREVWCCPAVDIVDCNKWTDVEQVVCNRSTRIINGKVSIEDRYFITSSKLPAQKILHSIREHWGIENKVHWVLDVAFAEDACQLRKDHAPENISTIRRWVLNILRGQTSRQSIKIRRKKAGWSTEFLETLLRGIFSNSKGK